MTPKNRCRQGNSAYVNANNYQLIAPNYEQLDRESNASSKQRCKGINVNKEIDIIPFEEDDDDFEIKRNKRKSQAIPYTELKLLGLDTMICSSIQCQMENHGVKQNNNKRESGSSKHLQLDDYNFNNSATPNTSSKEDCIQVSETHLKSLLKYTEKLNYKYQYDDQNGDKFCKICQDFLCEEDKVRRLNACGHFFHSKCLKKWMKKSIENSYCFKCKLRIRV